MKVYKSFKFYKSRLFVVRQMGLSSPSAVAKAERTIHEKNCKE